MSIRDNALNATLAHRIVDVPEWGGKVKVREMTSAERERYVTSREMGYLYTDAIIACVLDPDTDKPVFDQADRDVLKDLPAGPIERLFHVIADLSAFNEGAVDAAKEKLKDDPFADGS